MSLTQGMTVPRHLDLAFDVFRGAAPSSDLKNAVSPAYCYSDFSKNWAQLLKKKLPDNDDYPDNHVIWRKIRTLLQNLTTISDVGVLDLAVKNLIRLLGTKCDSAEVRALTAFVDFDDVPPSQEVIGDEPIDESNTTYSKSKLFHHFNVFAAEVAEENQDDEEDDANPYYLPDVLDHLLKHYIAYLPWWTIFVAATQVPSAKRSNNARVECHFRDIKDTCDAQRVKICRLGSIRIGWCLCFITLMIIIWLC